MNFLISMSTISLMYAFVYWAERKKIRDANRRQIARFPRAYRSNCILIVVLIIAAACTTTRFFPSSQVQVKLVSVKRLPHSSASLKFLNRFGDTLYMLQRNPYMAPKRYYINEQYTIQYDSSKVSVIDGKKYFLAVLKHNL